MQRFQRRVAGVFVVSAVLYIVSVSALMPRSTVVAAAPGVARELTLIGHIGGPTLSVATYGDYALVGHSFEFAIVDLSSPPSPQRIAYLMVSATDMQVVGNFAYVAGRDGLTIVDLSTPADPVIVGVYNSRKACTGIDVEQDRAVLTTSDEAIIIDVHDPQHPTFLTGIALDGRTEDAVIDDATIYVMGSYGVRILDVDRMSAVAHVADVDTGYVESAVLQDEMLYIANGDAGLTIVDVAHRRLSRVVGSISTGGYALGVAVQDGYAYVANGLDGTVIIEVSEPKTPSIAGTLAEGRYILAAEVADGLLLTGDRDSGLIVADIAENPSEPHAIGRLMTPGFSGNLEVQNGSAYVVANMIGDVHVVDIHNANQLPTTAHIRMPAPAVDVAVWEERLYIASGYDGLQALDISADADNLVDLWPGNILDVTVADELALLAGPGGVAVVSIADGESAQQISCFCGHGAVYRLALEGDIVFAAGGDNGLWILDIGIPEAPRLITHVPTYAEDIALLDGIAYVASGRDGMLILDINAPSDPQTVASIHDRQFKRVAVSEGQIYAVDAATGLHVYEWADLGDLEETAYFDTPDLAMSVVVEDGQIVLTDRAAGLFILK